MRVVNNIIVCCVDIFIEADLVTISVNLVSQTAASKASALIVSKGCLHVVDSFRYSVDDDTPLSQSLLRSLKIDANPIEFAASSVYLLTNAVLASAPI